MRKARRFISWEKQVFLVGFSLTFPRFPRISKNRLNTSLDKTPCLFIQKITQPERRVFLLIAEEFKGGSSSYTRDFSEGESIVLLEENVAQVSGRHMNIK